MSQEIMIKTEGLVKSYNISSLQSIDVLVGINLEIYQGEFVAIMGPSGAGKSTLLHCISTLELPTHGKIKIAGCNVRALTETQLNDFRYGQLGYVFQNFYLEPNLTNEENMTLPLQIHKVSSDEIVKRVKVVAEKLKITELLKKSPLECSGGQQQRVAIARALMTNPKLLVADEPTGNLDSQNGLELMKFFQELSHEGTTIVLVTHDPMIASFSTRLLYIQDGQLVHQLSRENQTQRAYFDEIVALNAKSAYQEGCL